MIARYASAFAIGTIVTFSLFMFMQFLVKNDEISLPEKKELRRINVVQDIEENPPQRRERELEQPPEPEVIEPEIDMPDMANVKPNALALAPPPSNASSRNSLGTINLGAGADGDYLPLAIQQPVYPRRAQERGIEGFCTVRLTVLADGSVDADSIELVEEEPANMFFRASKRAAAKFKYKPRMVDGKGQKVEGVLYRFKFTLADD